MSIGALIPWEDRQLLADNHRYFGDPVYEYTLIQGIEDGYLAPPDIHTFDLYHDNHQHAECLRRIGDVTFRGVHGGTTFHGRGCAGVLETIVFFK